MRVLKSSAPPSRSVKVAATPVKRAGGDTVEVKSTLPKEFTKLGWNFQQVFRKADVAVYRRWKDTSPNPHFEAIRIRWQEACERNGIHYAAGERYPSDATWGKDGFTLMDEATAITKAKSLISMARKKAS